MSKPVAIVTGASSGIGKDTVSALLKEGYAVYAGARRSEMMRDIEAAGAVVYYLDVTSQNSIDDFVQKVLDRERRVDVLVNNAGYGSYGAAEEVPLEEARHQFEVNLFGLAAMSNAVLPTMRNQGSGRLIHIGSVGGKLWSFMGSWYQATKFALEGYADCTRNELRPFGIHVVLIEPGGIDTEWVDVMMDNLRKTSGHGPYKKLAEAACKFYDNVKKRGAPPSVISRAVVEAVRSPHPKARYVAPGTIKVLLALRWMLSDRMFDAVWSRMQGIPREP